MSFTHSIFALLYQPHCLIIASRPRALIGTIAPRYRIWKDEHWARCKANGDITIEITQLYVMERICLLLAVYKVSEMCVSLLNILLYYNKYFTEIFYWNSYTFVKWFTLNVAALNREEYILIFYLYFYKTFTFVVGIFRFLIVFIYFIIH